MPVLVILLAKFLKTCFNYSMQEMGAEHILINCCDCVEELCKIDCKAIAFFCGNLIVETAKCGSCAKFKKNDVPNCIKDCPVGGAKTIIRADAVDEKRKNALETFLYL
jgi:hypothetical protein